MVLIARSYNFIPLSPMKAVDRGFNAAVDFAAANTTWRRALRRAIIMLRRNASRNRG